MLTTLLAPTLALALAPAPLERTTVQFPSEDGLEITADLYIGHDNPETPFLVLFHQANWSRGAYREIAPRLVELGFNCMAVDARSGGEVKKIANETHRRAVEEEMGTEYLDALPDLRAALRYARAEHAKGSVIAWGSSYSAALVLVVAAEHPELVDGVLAFSPGEYFTRSDKPKDWVASHAKRVTCPAFVTAARSEKEHLMPIYEALPEGTRTHYVPKTRGNHGSRALWKEFGDNAGYWKAASSFLATRFQGTG